MPDPVQCLLALALAAGASAVVALVPGGRPPAGLLCLLGLAVGLATGSCILGLPMSWPPASGLGRLLTIVLPATIGIEMLSAWPLVPRWLAWSGRLCMAMLAGRILLDGSVYLSGETPEWSLAQAAVVLLLSGGLLAASWALLIGLSRRAGGFTILAALVEAAFCTGLTVMMEGYLAGGLAALPVVGALSGCLAAVSLRRLSEEPLEGALGVGLAALFGIVFVGHFFGRVSMFSAMALLLAPLLCWTTEFRLFRRQPPWRLALIRLAFVAVPLTVVVLLAKRDFDRQMRPLLPRSSQAASYRQPRPAPPRMTLSPLV